MATEIGTRVRASQRLYDEIVDRIRDGRYPVSHVLTLADVRATFQVSTTVVVPVLERLVLEGVLGYIGDTTSPRVLSQAHLTLKNGVYRSEDPQERVERHTDSESWVDGRDLGVRSRAWRVTWNDTAAVVAQGEPLLLAVPAVVGFGESVELSPEDSAMTGTDRLVASHHVQTAMASDEETSRFGLRADRPVQVVRTRSEYRRADSLRLVRVERLVLLSRVALEFAS